VIADRATARIVECASCHEWIKVQSADDSPLPDGVHFSCVRCGTDLELVDGDKTELVREGM